MPRAQGRAEAAYNPFAFPPLHQGVRERPSMERRCGRYGCRDAGGRATQGAVAEDRVGNSDRAESW